MKLLCPNCGWTYDPAEQPPPHKPGTVPDHRFRGALCIGLGQEPRKPEDKGPFWCQLLRQTPVGEQPGATKLSIIERMRT